MQCYYIHLLWLFTLYILNSIDLKEKKTRVGNQDRKFEIFSFIISKWIVEYLGAPQVIFKEIRKNERLLKHFELFKNSRVFAP